MDVTHHLIDEVACLLHCIYFGTFDKTTPLHLVMPCTTTAMTAVTIATAINISISEKPRARDKLPGRLLWDTDTDPCIYIPPMLRRLRVL